MNEAIYEVSKESDKARSENFELVGYGSSLIFDNLGSLLYY